MEAALIFPLTVLIVAGIIFAGLTLNERVELCAQEHRGAAQERMADDALDSVLVVRGRWLLK